MSAPSVRTAHLVLHVGTSVGWMGAVLAYLALGISAVTSEDEQAVRAAYRMMQPVAWFVVLPLALTSLLTGIVQSLISPWGLFRHYWVTISLVATAVAALVLVLHLPAIDDLAATAADPGADVSAMDGDLFHAVGGLLVLLVPLVLNIAKPRGLTRHGWRVRQRSRQATPPPTAQ